MPIAGAIFDFDGTIVDSMPMWERVMDMLLARYGHTMTDELFAETEPMSLDVECEWLHEHLGMGESGPALLSELRKMVRHEYATSVKAWPLVREFLQSLAGAGIPMVVASSTPSEDVRVGLRTHGLEGFFKEVIFTGDAGRGKEFPDIYLQALEVLGTPLETTWVFEDAPVGVSTASKAGFPVVALLNDHDGRDERFLSRQADILVHGYGELSLELIEDYAAEGRGASSAGVLRALIVDGSPEPSSVSLVSRLAGECDYLIAADRGAETLFAAEAAPDVFCGDADSVAPEVAAWAHTLARTDIRFPSEKYATDLALAIACARHEAARRDMLLNLTVTCATGGRLDHQLAVIGLLAAHADASPRLVEDGFECRILSPMGSTSWEVGKQAREGATFSVIALQDQSVVSERGMRWELDRHELEPLGDRGMSNVVVAHDATVTCHEGVVAAFLMR